MGNVAGLAVVRPLTLALARYSIALSVPVALLRAYKLRTVISSVTGLAEALMIFANAMPAALDTVEGRTAHRPYLTRCPVVAW